MPKVLVLLVKHPVTGEVGYRNFREVYSDADREAFRRLHANWQGQYPELQMEVVETEGSECIPPFNRGQFAKYFA